ncbi:MAG TPA: phosphatase PAP2 family protein [Cytophagaceae bacterium]
MEILHILDKLDKDLLIFLNQLYHPVLDPIMLYATERFFWIPFYACLIIFIFWKLRLEGIWILLTIALLIVAADQFASGLLKPLTERLRPCHNEEVIPYLRLLKNCGGQYGFISSHAANTFALAVFLSLVFKKVKWMMLLYPWAFLVSYSRVYLAVHYPGDILAGAVSGAVWGIVFYYLYKQSFKLTKQRPIPELIKD